MGGVHHATEGYFRPVPSGIIGDDQGMVARAKSLA